MTPRVPLQPMDGFTQDENPCAVAFGRHISSMDGVDYMVSDSTSLTVGTMGHEGGEVVTLSLHRRPQTMPMGMGLLHTMTVEAARDTAAALLEVADMMERAAGEAAAAVLQRAARR